MNIKEAEKQTGISSKNIRFYEDEGLLHIPRNSENGYRDIDETILSQLQEIKLLRNLGVSLEDIRNYQKKQMSLKQLMDHRLKEIDETQDNMDMMRSMCAQVRDSETPFIPSVMEACTKQMLQHNSEIKIPSMGKRQMKKRVYWACYPFAFIIWILSSTCILPMLYHGLAMLSLISQTTAEQWSTSVLSFLLSVLMGIFFWFFLNLCYARNRQQFFSLSETGLYYLSDDASISKLRMTWTILLGKGNSLYQYVSFDDIYKVEPGLRVVGYTNNTGSKIFELVFRISTKQDENFILCCGLFGQEQSGINVLMETLKYHAEVIVDPYHLMDIKALSEKQYYEHLNKAFQHRMEQKLKHHRLDSLWG